MTKRGAKWAVVGALVLAMAFSWRLVLVVLAVLVVAALLRALVRGPADGRVLVVRVFAGAPTGMRIEIAGGLVSRRDEAIRDFVAELDLPPGAVLWVVREGPDLHVRGNHLVPDHLRQRFADFVGDG